MARKIKNRIKRSAKKYAKKNTGFVVCLILSIVLGLGVGVGACLFLTKNDGFTLMHQNAVYSGESVRLDSGKTYDINAKGNTPKVVSFGKDFSSMVKAEVFFRDKEGEEAVAYNKTTLEGDGTYYIIYSLDNSASGLDGLLAGKYDSVKLKKTVVIGGNE